MVNYGQVAYEAYCGTTGWKSLVSGAQLPAWVALSDAIRAAWEAAARAFLDAKEVYEVRHLTRIKALEAERDTALARIKAMEELLGRVDLFLGSAYATPGASRLCDVAGVPSLRETIKAALAEREG